MAINFALIFWINMSTLYSVTSFFRKILKKINIQMFAVVALFESVESVP